ncbi:MAG: hypothetical protein HY356_00775 [Gammaproteobacteria bacterium]|nr:hypothetical protein [Gammaproteobacteria bacterium]
MKKFHPLIVLVVCWTLAFQLLAATVSSGCRHEQQLNHGERAMLHTESPIPSASPHSGHHDAGCKQPDQKHTTCQCGCYCAGVCLHVCHSASITVSLEITAQPVVNTVFTVINYSYSTGHYPLIYRPPSVS